MNGNLCAVGQSGKAWCLGANRVGQLGTGTIDHFFHETPELVRSPEPLAQIQVGHIYFDPRTYKFDTEHVCALGLSGKVYCWGGGIKGKLGTGSTQDQMVPMEVVGLPEAARSVVVGNNHSCALGISGRAYCWGDNSLGALGTGRGPDQDHAVLVDSGSDRFRFLAAGTWRTCGILTSGQLRCWGTEPIVGSPVYLPSAVAGYNDRYRYVKVNGFRTCAISDSGQATCTGLRDYGPYGLTPSLGAGDTVAVESGPDLIQMSSCEHACYVYGNGLLRCSGWNLYGQLGLGDDVDRGANEPVSQLPYVEF